MLRTTECIQHISSVGAGGGGEGGSHWAGLTDWKGGDSGLWASLCPCTVPQFAFFKLNVLLRCFLKQRACG